MSHPPPLWLLLLLFLFACKRELGQFVQMIVKSTTSTTTATTKTNSFKTPTITANQLFGFREKQNERIVVEKFNQVIFTITLLRCHLNFSSNPSDRNGRKLKNIFH